MNITRNLTNDLLPFNYSYLDPVSTLMELEALLYKFSYGNYNTTMYTKVDEELCDYILKFMNSIFTYDRDCRFKQYVENSNLSFEFILSLIEFITIVPSLNIKIIDRLGFSNHLENFYINIIMNGKILGNKELMFKLYNKTKKFNYRDLIFEDPHKEEFALYFIASLYQHTRSTSNLYFMNLEGALNAEYIIYNKTLNDLLNWFYLDIPVCNPTVRKRNGMKCDEVIDSIWYYVYTNRLNPEYDCNHKLFYEFGAFDLWTSYNASLYDFNDTLKRIALDMYNIVVLEIGQIVALIISLEAKYKMLKEYGTFNNKIDNTFNVMLFGG